MWVSQQEREKKSPVGENHQVSFFWMHFTRDSCHELRKRLFGIASLKKDLIIAQVSPKNRDSFQLRSWTRVNWAVGEKDLFSFFFLSSDEVVMRVFGVRLLPSQQPPPWNLLSFYLAIVWTNTLHPHFAAGLTWHSLSERWWSYLLQMLEWKWKVQTTFLGFDTEFEFYPLF